MGKKVLMLASVASMIDQFNMNNINLLKQNGYEVHVAANFENGSTSSSERMIIFKRELHELSIRYFQVDFSRNIGNICQNLRAYKQVVSLLKNNKYEFVHCHSPIGGFIGRVASKVTNTKVIYTAHGFHFYKGAPLINWLLYYPVEKLCSYFTDILITINKEDYNFAINKMKSKKIYYIPGVGIDVEKYSNITLDKAKKYKELGISENDIMLLSVGELNKNKNHEIILRALSKINKKDVHYFIAGKGDLKDYLIKLAQDLNIQDRVHFLGFRNDIDEIYKVADIFCFPSFREGLSVSLMEAMAVGLPIICSNIRGNNDLVKNNINGFLCNQNYIDEFKESIERLINDSNLSYKFRVNNQNDILKFSIENVIKEMEIIYRLDEIN